MRDRISATLDLMGALDLSRRRQQIEQSRHLGRRRFAVDTARARRVTDTIEASVMKNVDIMTNAVSEGGAAWKYFHAAR